MQIADLRELGNPRGIKGTSCFELHVKLAHAGVPVPSSSQIADENSPYRVRPSGHALSGASTSQTTTEAAAKLAQKFEDVSAGQGKKAAKPLLHGESFEVRCRCPAPRLLIPALPSRSAAVHWYLDTRAMCRAPIAE